MMLPARACWPPNSFTPRRLLSLSRPLRDDPPAFLCAMTNYGPDYLPLGAFLAAPLAGAAFFVEVAAGALSAPVSLFPLGFFAGLSAPAAAGLLGAGFSVGVPTTSLFSCWSAVVLAVFFAGAGGGLPAPARGGFSAFG